MTEDAEAVGKRERRGSLPELAIVFGITVAAPLALSLASGQFYNLDFSQTRLLSTITAEVVLVAILWPWLAARGWAFRAIARTPEPMDGLRGCGVALLSYLAYYVNVVVWAAIVPSSYTAMLAATPTGAAAPWTIVLVSIVNPIVEEFLWLAYGVTALSRYGLRTAVAISIALRVVIHSYQGILALTGILPLAIVFTVYYARTRRLWPVVVAHVLFDTVGLVAALRR